MRYRQFGHTDLHVSEIGFGAWAIGGNAKVGNVPIGWGPADDATSRKAIHAAIDAGINFFDTADFYGLGHSEELLGQYLHGKENVIIATKVGHRSIDEKIVLDYSKEYIIKACEESLRRLKRECIDYYQLHSARMEHLQKGACIEAMNQLQKEGKIRYWGLSLNTFHPEAEAEFLMKHNYGQGFQLVFNLINQRALPLIERAAAAGYGIIARMPLQFGLLTGKFSGATHFEKDDHRSFRLTPEIIDQSNKILDEEVWPIASETGMTKTAFALSYILSYSGVSTVIPGIRTELHVQQNTEGIRQLDPGVVNKLHELSATRWKTVVELMEKAG